MKTEEIDDGIIVTLSLKEAKVILENLRFLVAKGWVAHGTELIRLKFHLETCEVLHEKA